LSLLALSLCIEQSPMYSQIIFKQWCSAHNKEYNPSTPEYNSRFDIWKKNFQYIQEHNERFHNKEVSFSLKMNLFGDLTQEEFAALVLKKNNIPEYEVGSFPDADIPDSFDWRTKGVVNGVINQGQCGDSLVIAQSNAIRSCYAIKTGKLLNVNIEQMAICLGKGTCTGHISDPIYPYVIKCGILTGGSSTATTCTYQNDAPIPAIDSYKTIPKGNETELAIALALNGPVAVLVDASKASFQFYSNGIYYEPTCSANQLDHALLNVGYGVESGKKFWIVQNSWGSSWGNKGYIMMSKDKHNNCGIASQATYPIYGTSKYSPDKTCNGI